jgi:two-component system, NarL family, nitrate/nitrite response regulator NarL
MATWQQLSPSPTPIRVLVASGHTLFRGALRELIESGGFEVVGETSDGQSVVTLAKETGADVILLDMAMPLQNAISVLRDLSIEKTPARTLLLTTSLEREQVVRAIKLGACGVIPQDSTPQLLFDSIRCVMAGQYWVGRDNVSDLVKALREEAAPNQTSCSRQYGLTPREMQIVTLIVAGYSNPDIAQRFSISEQTVKHHISHIFDKVGVSNRLELALFAVNHKLTELAS